MELLVIGDTSTLEDIKAAIVALRWKQDRMPAHHVDARAEVGAEIDRLVDRVLAAR